MYLFASRSARYGFVALIGGFLVLMAAGLYLFTAFVDISSYEQSPSQVSKYVLRSIRLAKAMSVDTLAEHLNPLQGPSLQIGLSDEPLSDSRVAYTINENSIREIVRADFNHLKISVPLAKGRWLNIQRKLTPNPWFSAGFISMALVLFSAILMLCYWVVRWVSAPTFSFADAARQFSMDLHAPPLAVSGSAETQDAIQAFNEMQRRVRRMVQDRTQMLAAVAHDLRTPITRLQLRLEHFKASPHYSKALNDLKQMEDMIASILLFARDHARLEPMERFDAVALMASICDDMADMGYDVAFHSSLDRLIFFGRMHVLRRSLTNFIDNAIKYGNFARVTLQSNDRMVEIRIEDGGPGIPESMLEKVFDPFFRVDAARSATVSGTGLGMTVAREVIRSHGGDVMLMNRQTAGLLVLITLPHSGKANASGSKL